MMTETFKLQEFFQEVTLEGTIPKIIKNKYANNSHTRQHYSRNNSRSHSRGRSTDFKLRSYSRDKNQRHQSRSPFSRYDSTRNTYTTRDNNRSRDRFRNGSHNNRSRERFRNESQKRY